MLLNKDEGKSGADTGSVPPLNAVWQKHYKPAVVEQQFIRLVSKAALPSSCFAQQIQYPLKH